MRRVSLLLIIVAIFYGQSGNKQNPMPDYIMLERRLERLKGIYSGDTGEGGFVNEYERWKSFGSYRFYNLNNSFEIFPICDSSVNNSN